MNVSLPILEKTVEAALKKYGYKKKEIEVIKNVLLFAQLRGNNQGIVKLVGNGIPRRTDDGNICLEKETKVSGLVNGKKNHAMVVFDFATDIAIEKAKECGIGIVGNFNSSESTGALGYYVEKAAKEDLIGIAYASAPFKAVAPYGSTEALLCTNPIAYAIPTKNDPLLLDFATSEIAFFGLIEAKIASKDVPLGTGFDSEGFETTSPEKIMSGAIKAIAGHRGSGLSLMVQIFAGPLINAGYLGKEVGNAGNLMIVFDPELFTSKKAMSSKIEEITELIKSSKKSVDTKGIYMPGERGYRTYNQNIKNGSIDIEDSLWEKLLEVIE